VPAGAVEKPVKRVAPAPANPFPAYPLHETLEGAPLPPVPAFKRTNRPRDHLWASELGTCARAVWLNWHYPRPHDDDFSQHRGALGHAVEEVLASKLSRMLIAREVSFNESRVSGRTDFVVYLEGQQIPVELKSTYAFQRMLADPRESHVLQLLWYIQQLGVPFGLLVYFDLSNYAGNSGHWSALRIPRDDARLEIRIGQLWMAVHSAVEPACESPEEKCWDCGLAEGKAHAE